MQHVLVTGANGFVGAALCRRLISDGYQITAALRRPVAVFFEHGIRTVEIKEIDREIEWSAALRTVDIVVHLAARVHLMADDSDGSYASYHRVNVLGTRTLAQCAADAGIKRFVYLSSVKVNGEENAAAYKECDKPSPVGGYAVSLGVATAGA